MRMCWLGWLLLFSMPVGAVEEAYRVELLKRISPVGKVRVQQAVTAPSKPASVSLSSGRSEKKTGESIYEQYCVVCHRDGIAGAPKFRDESDWKPRLAKQNLDSLTLTAIQGLNAMPAKGTCQTCSDEDIKAAVAYMVPQ